MDKVKAKYMLRIILKVFLALILLYVDLALLGAPFYDPDIVSLGGDYQISEGVGYITGPKIDVPPKILNYSFDDRFIIVKQRLEGNPGRIFTESNDYNYPYLHCTYYWIIDKAENTYYGPLFYEQYKEKSDSLNVKLSFQKDNEKTMPEFRND